MLMMFRVASGRLRGLEKTNKHMMKRERERGKEKNKTMLKYTKINSHSSIDTKETTSTMLEMVVV